jgi:hypothetical protein
MDNHAATVALLLGLKMQAIRLKCWSEGAVNRGMRHADTKAINLAICKGINDVRLSMANADSGLLYLATIS